MLMMPPKLTIAKALLQSLPNQDVLKQSRPPVQVFSEMKAIAHSAGKESQKAKKDILQQTDECMSLVKHT